MDRTVVIDCFPESIRHYKEGYAIVAVDPIRATTTAVTAVVSGRRCFPVPSIEVALPIAARLDNPLLVGELGGNMPYGFDMNNSPAELSRRNEVYRPMILLSSTGTKLMYDARDCDAAYIACFRNKTSVVNHLIGRHRHVAVIGSGTRGEFREEDQMCCALVAAGLMNDGYRPEDARTVEIVKRWNGQPVDACMHGKSVEYLRKTGQLRDLDFILSHIDDLDAACMIKHDEVVLVSPSH